MPSKSFQKSKSPKKENTSKMHPRNKHNGRYDLKVLCDTSPELKPFVLVNDYGSESIDFFNADAVKALNTALLKHHYGISHWDIPKGYLCPPIPGRADYIHHVADLLKNNNYGKVPNGKKIKCLDLGTGSNAIYSLIGIKEYGWEFVASDIDEVAIESAKKIGESNPDITELFTVRLQKDPKHTFEGIIRSNEHFDLTICNPPFHSSLEESQKSNLRKLRNLKKDKVSKPERNFEGVSNELWCEGGELRFIEDMIFESKKFGQNVFWFTTLVSKYSNLRAIHKILRAAHAVKVETIEMGQGNKSSRIVAWTFLRAKDQQEWKQERWHGDKSGLI